MSDIDCSIEIPAREQRNNAQLVLDAERIETDEDDVSSHDGFTTIVSDNDLVQRDIHPPLDISTSLQEEEHEERPRNKEWNWQRIRFLSLYFVTVTILFSDVNLMAPNLTTMAQEFGFDENERDVKLGGMIALGFFFVGAPVSYIIGWLADCIDRTPLFAATVFIGELGCFLVYFVETYQQLYACRVLTGISIGGAIPIVFSVLGDLYPANQRSIVAAVVTTGSGLGMGIGQVIAGMLDDWRLPFLIVSIPGIVCSFAILCFNDPPRGANEAAVIEFDNVHAQNQNNQIIATQESALSQSDVVAISMAHGDHVQPLENCGMNCDASKVQIDSECQQATIINTLNLDALANDNDTHMTIASEEEPSAVVDTVSNETSCKSTFDLFKTPSVLLIILQAAPGSLPFGFCATFLNDYLQQQRGMTKEAATGVLVTFGAGNAIGVILGGCIGCSYKRDVRLPPLFMGISLILGCIPFYFLVNHVHQDVNAGVTAAITTISGALVVIPVPLERAILTNVCLPRSRGRANSLVSIVDDLGKGLGPALVSLLITTFDRQTAFNISLFGWIVGGILSLFIILFVADDEEKVQQKLREQMLVQDVSTITGEA